MRLSTDLADTGTSDSGDDCVFIGQTIEQNMQTTEKSLFYIVTEMALMGLLSIGLAQIPH